MPVYVCLFITGINTRALDGELKRRSSKRVRVRLSSLRLSAARENEIVEELSRHLDDRWRDLIASGASPDEAREETLAAFKGQDILAAHMAPRRNIGGARPTPWGNLSSWARCVPHRPDRRAAIECDLSRQRPDFAIAVQDS